MKEFLYIPPLIGALLVLYAVASKSKPARALWPPMLALNVCSMEAMAPKNIWWLLAAGGVAGLVAVYYFFRVFGFRVVLVSSAIALFIVLALADHYLWFVASFLIALVVSMFDFGFAVRKYGRERVSDELSQYWR